MRFDLLVCRRYGLDTEWAASRMGAELISEERETGLRVRGHGAGMETMLQGPLGEQIASALLDGPRGVVTWRSTETLEALDAASNGQLRVLAVPAALKRRLDNKIAFRKALAELGIEPVPHVLCDLTAVDFRRMEQRYGLPFVVQLAVGAGGSGTFFIDSEQDLRSVQDEHAGETVTVSKFISSVSPNINAVVCGDLVLLSHPSLQLVGVPQCVSRRSKYCGNDYVAAQRLPGSVIQAIYDQTRRIAAWIGKKGFRGLWGLDFAVDGTDVYPLELNPRLQGSTALLTELQHLNHETPLWLAHVVAHLEGGRKLLESLAPVWGEPQRLSGSQVSVLSRADDWRVVRGAVKPGVYAWDGAQATYLREGLTIADCRTTDEFVLTNNVPKAGTRCEARVGLCKIQTRREVADGASTKLQPWAQRLCDWVYDALSLS
jgi:hypothetical protein